MREQYWNFFVSTKHKFYYYKHFLILFNRINGIISAFLTITTLSGVAALSIWQIHPSIWAGIICISQIIQAVLPRLPYSNLLAATRFMIPAMNRLLLDIEYDWNVININDSSDKEILSLLQKYRTKAIALIEQFFNAEYLPTIKYCEKNAEKECRNFFAIYYAIQGGGSHD